MTQPGWRHLLLAPDKNCLRLLRQLIGLAAQSHAVRADLVLEACLDFLYVLMHRIDSTQNQKRERHAKKNRCPSHTRSPLVKSA